MVFPQRERFGDWQKTVMDMIQQKIGVCREMIAEYIARGQQSALQAVVARERRSRSERSRRETE